MSKVGGEDGFTIIEVLAALIVLIVGILGAYIAFESSQRISLVSERHTAMTQMAQQAIEQIEGLPYNEIGLDCGGSSGNTCPQNSTDATNPDYYVSTDGTTLQVNRTSGGSTEPLDIDATNGAVKPVTSWTQTVNTGSQSDANLAGFVYEFVTTATDSQCSPGCNTTPGSPSVDTYKRITVAVTMTSGLQPDPVYVSSVVANPDALGQQGVVNGSAGNPILNPNVNCTLPSGATGPCTAGLDNGNANTYFLHDWPATSAATPTDPAADNATHPTVGITTGGTCTTVQSQVQTPSQVTGCPVPDLMDTNSPSGDNSTPLYNYSNDQCTPDTSCYPGGREVQSLGQGTGSSSDCSNGAWSASLMKNQNEMWVTPALTGSMALTGAGGLTFYAQTLDNATQNTVVSLCIELYDVPPSGSSGSLADLIAYPPTALGGAAYIGPTDPSSGGNWPNTPTQISFTFSFTGATVPAGDRIGLRVWEKSNPSAPIDVIYDNPNYPSQLQLNSQ